MSSSSSSERTRFVQRVIAFYKKYDPSKIDNAEMICEKYEDQEDNLFEVLIKKYGPEPEPEPEPEPDTRPEFVGIANFPASSSMTPHRTLLRPVFLQHIHRFGATKVISPINFKNVTSSWEDAMVNYTSISVCWKNRYHTNEAILGTVACVVHKACNLDGNDPANRWAQVEPLEHLNSSSDDAEDALLLSAAIRFFLPLVESATEVVEEVFGLREGDSYDGEKVLSTFSDYVRCRRRNFFSPTTIALFFELHAKICNNGKYTAGSVSQNMTEALEKALLYTKDARYSDSTDASSEKYQDRDQCLFSAFVIAVASPQLVDVTALSQVGFERFEEEKMTRLDEILIPRLSYHVNRYPEILSPSSLVKYFSLAKEIIVTRNTQQHEAASSSASSEANNKNEEKYRNKLLFVDGHSGNGTLFSKFLSKATDVKTVEKYLQLVEREKGAVEPLRKAIEEQAENTDRNILFRFFKDGTCIDEQRVNILFTFLKGTAMASSAPKQLVRKLLFLEKKKESSAKEEEERKVFLVAIWTMLCDNDGLKFSGFKVFVDTLRQMNLLDDFAEELIEMVPEVLTVYFKNHCLLRLVAKQSPETINYFFEKFCGNDKAIIKKMLSSKNLLYLVYTEAKDRNNVVFACDLMCEYGIFEEHFENAVKESGKTDSDLANGGLSRHHLQLWDMKKRDEEKDERIAELEERLEEQEEKSSRLEKELALIKTKLGL